MKTRTLVLVEADLLGRARLEPVALAAGWEVRTQRAPDLVASLRRDASDLVVVDLDRGGEETLAALRDAAEAGVLPEQVVGYYSHVDEDLGRRARAAGCRAVPRGRFWSTLESLLGGDAAGAPL